MIGWLAELRYVRSLAVAVPIRTLTDKNRRFGDEVRLGSL